MDWGLGGSPLFVCLLLVFAEKASSFFYDAICARARKACIVCTCKPLVNHHCVKALMTIPFELPTLLFFHGLELYSVRQGKQERNGHFLAEQLCETRLPSCFVCGGLWQSKTLAVLRKVQEFSALDGGLNWTAYMDINILSILAMTSYTTGSCLTV